jgi:flagellin
MVASILTNVHAGYASANLRGSIEDSKTSAIRMSSGNQITKASDDASGLSIGSGLKTDVQTLKAALKSTSQASSILSVADGILANIGDILGRLRSLAVTANSSAVGTAERGYIDKEMDSLVVEITRVAGNTKFNGSALLDGTFTAKDFQVGVLSTDVITVGFAQDMRSAGLSITSLDVTSTSGAVTSIASLDTAIGLVKTERSNIGALQSTFKFAANNIETSMLNTDSARADYLDADIATESTAFSNATTRIQAGVSVLAQVNQLPQNLLKLIG